MLKTFMVTVEVAEDDDETGAAAEAIKVGANVIDPDAYVEEV
jgi:hypothetical protein